MLQKEWRSPVKVLVCEDDLFLREGLVRILREEGYRTVEAHDGRAAVEAFVRELPDFVCLDIIMAGMNGYEVCKAIRRRNEFVPVMFISARSEEVDRILGLELGADDYVVKPFAMKEVIARIRAITRRCNRANLSQTAPFEFGSIRVHPDELCAYGDFGEIELSMRDVQLLSLLHSERGRVVTRERIFDQCWDMNYIPNSRTLDQHISKLRRKIGQSAEASWPIETVHGVGYRFPKAAPGQLSIS